MKTTLYIIMITCYFTVGAMELQEGQIKPGVLSICFGVLAGLIFLWRP